jgi:hypothetical protein
MTKLTRIVAIAGVAAAAMAIPLASSRRATSLWLHRGRDLAYGRPRTMTLTPWQAAGPWVSCFL